MDIAKIRKKAREKASGRQAAEDTDQREEKAVEGGGPETPAPAPQADEASAGETTAEVESEYGANSPSMTGTEEDTYPGPPAGKEDKAVRPSGTVEADEGGEILELLTFSLSNEEFAFRVSEVEEIIRFQRITKVPTMPDYVCGITSLRGKIIPVVDLKSRLVLKESLQDRGKRGEFDPNGKILILSGSKGLIGATIDKVMGVVRFPSGGILDPPAHLTEEEMKFIEGIVILDKRFISIVRAYDALDIEVA